MSRHDDAETLDTRLRQRGAAARIEHNRDQLDDVYASVMARVDVTAKTPVTTAPGELDGTVLVDSPRNQLYYSGPRIVVTRDYIATPRGRYLVRDLRSVHTIHVDDHTARTVALICGAMMLLLGSGLAVTIGSAALLIAGLIAAVGVIAGFWADASHNPRLAEFVAHHKGKRIVLFVTYDPRVFEQVRRALIRSFEANRRAG
ncbi:DUF6232 family protein [Actinoplanes sp. NPDC000266]